MTTSTTARRALTDDQVGDLIVEIIERANGVAAWADVRRQLPRATWDAAKILVRLETEDRVGSSQVGTPFRCFVSVP